MSDLLDLARELIRRPSVTPDDAGCQALLAERLAGAGFQCEPMRFGAVNNLWARRGGAAPLLVFAGHTDVVPPGPLDDWSTDPFKPEIRDGVLHGRGAADMKGSLAAMLIAAESFVREHPDHAGSIGFLVTSDEEGQARDGTRRVMEALTDRGERIDWCVVGEPSSSESPGDTIRRGRRGSLTGRLTVLGAQGHVAYPDSADNPIHAALPALAELAARQWDEGFADFPATSFQIANFTAGTGADNVIPGRAEIQFNLRYSPALTPEDIQATVAGVLENHAVRHHLDWHDSGRPFHTPDGPLLDAVAAAVREHTGTPAKLSTGGGTSDGRFIAPTGTHVVELGPLNATIHQPNERVAVPELELLGRIYRRILERLLLE